MQSHVGPGGAAPGRPVHRGVRGSTRIWRLGQAAHRMALDHADCVKTLTVMDIVPTYTMFMQASRHLAQAYWHWYFLAQPEPFPETLIARDPDFSYETSLLGWGAAQLEDFDAEMMSEYRRAWRNPEMIHVANTPCRHDGCRLAGRPFFRRSVSAGDGADSRGFPHSSRERGLNVRSTYARFPHIPWNHPRHFGIPLKPLARRSASPLSR